MSNSYTESNSSSFGSRIGGAIMGVLIAPLILLGGSGFLFWNEGRTVHTAQSLDEGEKQVVTIAADKIDPANNGKLVYVTGKTAVEGELHDEKLGIKATAIKLKRVVEMYQWEEDKKTKNNKTTYTYHKKWMSGTESSRSFHRSGYDNPGTMPLHSQDFVADKVTFGAFTLSDNQIARADHSGNRTPRNLSAEEFAALPEEIRAAAVQSAGGFYMPVGKWFAHAPKDQIDNKFQPAGSSSESNPQIGDVRVKILVVNPGPTTIIAEQSADHLGPHKTKAGVPIDMFRTATHSVPEMFELARKDNTMWAWIFRGAGVGAIFVSFMFLMGPLTALTDWIPGLGAIVGGGVFLVAAAGTLVIGSLVISFAWLFYRPLLAIAIVVVCVGLVVLLVMLFRKKKPEVHSSGLEIVS